MVEDGKLDVQFSSSFFISAGPPLERDKSARTTGETGKDVVWLVADPV
jgi:hypothetical protein